jgi:tetratricopeptide (TPR) repeat protein
MRLEQWDKALAAFSRVTQQEPETGEAWNNMASIYASLKKKYEISLKFSLIFKA